METNPQQSPETLNAHHQKTQWRIALKFAIILLILIVLIIPITLVRNLIYERAERNTEVINNVSSKWGLEQIVTGPYLEIPITSTNPKTKQATTQKLFIMSSQLNIKGQVTPHLKERSLYKVMLYESSLEINGNFKNINWQKIGIDPNSINWQKAKLYLGITDTKGILGNATIQWGNTTTQELEYGIADASLIQNGIQASVNSATLLDQDFQIKLQLKGSKGLHFSPTSNNTNVQIQSNYPHPSFNGNILPDLSEVSKSGFEAKWNNVSKLRSFPQAWIDQSYDLNNNYFGVNLLEMNNHYTKTERVVKYALLFIGLAFGVFFLIETIKNLQLHPINYILVGVALIIFYSLLLSLSEFIGFNKAYFSAAAATIVLIGIYINAIIPKKAIVIAFTIGLTTLYGYVFFIIQLEDYALIFGSIALFIVLASIMYFTRKINWSRLS